MRDLRDAVRSLLWTPASSLLALVSLTLGLGTALAVFGVVDAVLFRPLPVRDPDRLVALVTSADRRPTPSSRGRLSVQTYRACEDMRALAGVAAYREGILVHLATGQRPAVSARVTVVAGRYFDLLGLSPARGRLLGPGDDEREGAHPVVVAGYEFWRTGLGADEAALGRTVHLNGRAYTVVGVAPRGFHGVALEQPADLYVPLAMAKDVEPLFQSQLQFVSFTPFDAVGRLARGSSREQAQAEAELIADRSGAGRRAASGPEAGDPDWRAPWLHVRPLHEVAAHGSRPLATLLIVAVGLLLLIAVADTAGILLARADRKRTDVAIRVALGASPGSLVRGRLGEGLVLGAIGALAGLLLATLLVRGLVSLVPEPSPLPLVAATSLLSTRAGVVGTCLVLMVSVAASAIPALRAAHAEPAGALKRLEPPGRTMRVRPRHALVVAQVALSLALLSATALMIRTLDAARRFAAQAEMPPVLVGTVDLARAGYSPSRAVAFEEELRQRLAHVPGAESVTISASSPFGRRTTTVAVAGRSAIVSFEMASPGHVATLALPLLRGRDVRPGDRNAALVSEAFAQRFWPGEDPLGKTIEGFTPRLATLEVVGVVRGSLGGPRDKALPLMIVPRAEFYGAFPYAPRTVFYVRSSDAPHHLGPAARRIVRELDPHLPLLSLRAGHEQTSVLFARERLLAVSFGVLGLIAVVLSASGLFGVMASATEARRREIGVRIAIGAERRDVLTLVLGQSARLVVVGILLGVPLALIAGRWLSSFLYGVAPHDAGALAMAALVLAVTGLLASYGPTRRALSVDPVRVLRSE